MKRKTRRVIKLGGSLLDQPRLGAMLAEWLEASPTALNLLVVGGGHAVNRLRLTARDTAETHWRAIDCMERNAWALGQQIGWPALGKVGLTWPAVGGLQRDSRSGVILDQISLLLRDDNADMPHSWDVTSDSIAAWIAGVSAADELVLLKSCGVDAAASADALAEDGVVDRHFPYAAVSIDWRIENLRPRRP